MSFSLRRVGAEIPKMSADARTALQSIVDMFHDAFRGPAPDELLEAVATAEWGLKGIDRTSNAWDPTPIEFTDQDVQESLKELCGILGGPLMDGAPKRVLDIVENGRRHITSDPNAGLSPGC